MKSDEIIAEGVYSNGLGSVRKVLAITNSRNQGSIVKHELTASKISKNIGSIHKCKLASFANWAWERIE